MMLAVLACGDSVTDPAAALVGNWNLSTANGSAMPFLAGGSGANKTELTGAVLSVTATGYTIIFSVRTTTNGVASTATSTDAGTYVVSGTTITLHSTVDASVTPTGTISGNTLTLSVPGYVYVFTR